MNNVNIVGNLTRDPELKYENSLYFSVAINNRWKNRDGVLEDHPCYVDCHMHGDRAVKLAGILTKGMKVGISGKLHYRSWEKDGEKRSALSVNVIDLDLMSYKTSEKASEPYDEDVPF